jgi:modulator of FtsH protease HflC
VNEDPKKVRLAAFEDQLRAQVAPRMQQVYGIAIRQIGIERLTLQDETLEATVKRMAADRQIVATKVQAEGLATANKIRADAEKEARQVKAAANEKASRTEADAQQAAARTYQRAYQSDPKLYTTLRSLDAIDQMVSKGTNIILRMDSVPFQPLVDGPGVTDTEAKPASAAPASAPASAPAKPAAATQTPAPAKGSAPQEARRP